MSRRKYHSVSQDPIGKKEVAPFPTSPIPNQQEYTKGMYTRYFVRKRSDHTYAMEVDKKQFDTLTQDKKGVNGSLYEGFQLKWRVRGKLHDKYRKGARIYPGVFESNQRLLKSVSDDFPQIKNLIRDFTQYAVIEPDEGSSNITTNNEDHYHYVFIDDMGNGHTSEHVNPKNSNIKHYHEIRNFIIQEAQDICYPDCFMLYGYQGVGLHTHEIEQ